ncbi:MAG: DNA mismatch repair protein MutS, partial [Bacteroidales bacterium]|nr:DNA mismatch repair protein MutS [Bacteroidales bacterium]
MNNTLHQFYTDKVAALTTEIAELKCHNTTFVLAELAAFVAMLASLVAYTLTSIGVLFIILAVISFAVYYFIRQVDAGKNYKADECERLLKVYENELSYLNGDFSCFDVGEKYIDPRHPFTFDMDIFGAESLFNRINRTVTTGGSDYLATVLSQTEAPSAESIVRRREAIAELAERESLRSIFLMQGRGRHINTDAILEALREVREADISPLALSRTSLVMAILSIIVFYGLLIGAVFGPLPGSWPMLWLLVQVSAAYLFFGRTLKKVNGSINVILPRLGTYVSMIMLIVESNLKSQEAREIIGRLSDNQQSATKSFRQLKSILNDLDQRNEVWVPISNALYLADYFIVRRFLKWQQQYMPCIEDWILAVSHFDALVSMATFRYNEPAGTDAEIIEADAIVYSAQGLYHPFLGEMAVRNDFQISDGHYYIVTGANMAGKSTFLRSVGINYILALCGLPVFANHLKVSRFSLFSSMRTTDDLAHGISYFNAELLRLQQLIGYCKQNRHTLIILDEILKGTNSLDKLNGSRLFLQSISSLPVTGIVATHDLELSKMQQESPDRFHNYCFEIQLSDEITYTYRITEGVA